MFFSHIKMTYPKLTEAWHCWSRAWCGTIWWYNKSGYCTYALNPACAFPRITVTFDSPQRGSLVFTVGADEDGNKNNSLLWSSVSHGVRTERLKNIENLCQACKVKMLKKVSPKLDPMSPDDRMWDSSLGFFCLNLLRGNCASLEWYRLYQCEDIYYDDF